MDIEIKGSYLEVLFDLINMIYTRHRFSRQGWDGWPSLNEYYPSHLVGNFIVTDENNYFEEFRSSIGSHPVLGSGFNGNHGKAWAELTRMLGLELVDDLDGANFLTYPGHRKRYWKITVPEYAGDWTGVAQVSGRPRDISDTVAILKELNMPNL